MRWCSVKLTGLRRRCVAKSAPQSWPIIDSASRVSCMWSRTNSIRCPGRRKLPPKKIVPAAKFAYSQWLQYDGAGSRRERGVQDQGAQDFTERPIGEVLCLSQRTVANRVHDDRPLCASCPQAGPLSGTPCDGLQQAATRKRPMTGNCTIASCTYPRHIKVKVMSRTTCGDVEINLAGSSLAKKFGLDGGTMTEL